MQDGLNGKLDDLGLDEILQIISVSRRTGVLILHSAGREAKLRFRDGLVIQACSSAFSLPLGELLVRVAGVDQTVVLKALALQRSQERPERIGVILRRSFGLDLQQIEMVMRKQMESVMLTLFSWVSGDYDFVPDVEMETVDAAYLDPLQLLREHGEEINRHSSETVSQADVCRGEAVGKPEKKLPSVVLADDDDTLCRAVAAAFADQFDVVWLSRTEDALVKVDTLYKEGVRPFVVVDLIMPRMDGSGVLGGLELIQLIRANFPELSAVAISDFHHADALEQLSSIGTTCLSKPRRGDLKSDLFHNFIDQLKASLIDSGIHSNS